MSSLARYLAPFAARPNPGFVVEWRHGEGGPWLPMADTESLEDAASELASPAVSLTRGDLARVRDPGGALVGFSVQTDAGLVALPPGGENSLREAMQNEKMEDWFRACGHDWERAWEGSVRADWLVHLAGWVGVDRRLLVLAACDCVEMARRYVPAGEERPRATIEAARRWARGEATLREVQAAEDAAMDASGEAWADGNHVAAWVAQATAEAAAGARADVWAARDALWDAAWAIKDVVGATESTSLASMAPLVRRHIPLWRLALALADLLRRFPDSRG